MNEKLVEALGEILAETCWYSIPCSHRSMDNNRMHKGQARRIIELLQERKLIVDPRTRMKSE